MILEVRDLRVHYDNVILAVDGIDMDVAEGEIVSLLGANGAGKSTCLKAISGLLALEGGKITRGEVRFAGAPVNSLSPFARARAGIALVAEGREILKNLTVEENLGAGAYTRKDGKDEIRKDFERVCEYFPVLRKRLRQTAGTLSGGEQQMLVIARSLMLRPRLLLLDEPSLGLAPLVALSVMEEVSRINRELGTTILLVEQNAALALPISKKLYILTNGRVAVSCAPDELSGADISRYYLGGKGQAAKARAAAPTAPEPLAAKDA